MSYNRAGEVQCPVDGCPTGLQRGLSGPTDGVVEHLRIVHFPDLSHEVLRHKFRTQLDKIREAFSH